MDVTFTDDIPKIERQGFERSSKYDELLKACVENAGKAAKMTVEGQGAASSRATSIKTAASNHDAEKNDEGVFVVATRSDPDNDNQYHIYTMFAESGTEEYNDEIEAREKRAEAAAKRKAAKRKKAKAAAAEEANETESDEDEAPALKKAAPKAKKKAARKKG